MSDGPRPPQRPASDPLPDATTADPAPIPSRGPAAAERPPDDRDTPRTPDEYLETPGSHRRGDGAATDVGA